MTPTRKRDYLIILLLAWALVFTVASLATWNRQDMPILGFSIVLCSILGLLPLFISWVMLEWKSRHGGNAKAYRHLLTSLLVAFVVYVPFGILVLRLLQGMMHAAE